MQFRNLFLIPAALISLGACSSTSEQGGYMETSISDREGITTETLYGTEIIEEHVNAGPTAGTQQDLVVNIGDRVFFGYDRYDLNSESRSVIELQANWLKNHSSITITIAGHADERGTREYNLALAERRANSVKSYIVALGVAPYRINTVSFGKEQPAVLGSNPSAWAQNRRSVTQVD